MDFGNIQPCFSANLELINIFFQDISKKSSVLQIRNLEVLEQLGLEGDDEVQCIMSKKYLPSQTSTCNVLTTSYLKNNFPREQLKPQISRILPTLPSSISSKFPPKCPPFEKRCPQPLPENSAFCSSIPATAPSSLTFSTSPFPRTECQTPTVSPTQSEGVTDSPGGPPLPVRGAKSHPPDVPPRGMKPLLKADTLPRTAWMTKNSPNESESDTR